MQELYPKLLKDLQGQVKMLSQYSSSDPSGFEVPSSVKFRSDRSQREQMREQLVEMRAEVAGMTATLSVRVGAARSVTPLERTLTGELPWTYSKLLRLP